MASGIGILKDDEYTKDNCLEIIKNREFTENALKELGFSLTPSTANFVFARHSKIDGKTLYTKLKERGILVRHFDKQQISQYNRITIGTREQMETLVNTIKNILEDK